MFIPTLPDGLVLDIGHANLSQRERAHVVLGLRERAELRFVIRWLPSDADVVDLGASIGTVGARAVKRLAPGQRYVGVEMVPWAAEIVTRNLRRHAPPNVSVTVVNAAICSAYQTVGIYHPGRLAAAGAMPGTEVAATTLSKVIADFGIRDGYTLLMDIEGSECDVLTNDAPALEGCSMMIVELHDASPTHANPWACSADESLSRLTALDFRVRDQRPPVYCLERFSA
jgi:FkbM family methyltransferase